MSNCILCGTVFISFIEIDNTLIYSCKCSNCGDYEISYEALSDLPEKFTRTPVGTKNLISGYALEMNDYQSKLKILDSNIDDIIKIVKQKATIEHKLDRLLFYINSKTNYFGEEIEISKTQTAICYAFNRQELENLCTALRDRGYIKLEFRGRDLAECTLQPHGYVYIDEKTKENTLNRQCFVAMWFDKNMIEKFSPNILAAIADTGFDPFVSVNQEHNNDICDSIIAGIKNSRFMIADFTGQRPSVYFEAGMALGLGIPVIWTCKEDWFNNQAIIKKEALVDGENQMVDIYDERHVHFDVNHYKFIVWSDGEDLYKKLVNRIEATIK